VEINVVNSGGILERNNGAVLFVKTGGRLTNPNYYGHVGFWESEVKETKRRTNLPAFDVPAIVASPVPDLVRIGPSYPILPQQAKPVAQLMHAVTHNRAELLDPVFTTRRKNGWENLPPPADFTFRFVFEQKMAFEKRTAEWLKQLTLKAAAPREAVPLRFSSAATKRRGRSPSLTIRKRVPVSFNVIYEDKRWKIDTTEPPTVRRTGRGRSAGGCPGERNS